MISQLIVVKPVELSNCDGSDDDDTENEAIKITQYLGCYVPEIFGRMPLDSQEKNVIPSRRLLLIALLHLNIQ